MIAIDLIKQQSLDADLKTIQQIHFTRNLDLAENTAFFLYCRSEITIFYLLLETVRVICNYFSLI